MPDAIYPVLNGLSKRLKDMGDGTHAEVVAASGFAANPSASFTRPADTTAYAIGDLIANSTTAGSVVPMQFTVAREAAGSCMIRRVKISTSNVGGLNAIKRLHLFSAAPVPVNGDNGAFSSTGTASYLGAFEITLDRAFTDGACGFGGVVSSPDPVIKLASGQIIYGLLEARSANTPASGSTITVTLETLQN